MIALASISCSFGAADGSKEETARLPDEMPDWWAAEGLNIAEPHE
jgi:hypothetical protein